MSRLGTFALTAIALLWLVLPSGDAAGQHEALKEQLVGTWAYVTVDVVRPEGSRVPLYGPNPSGLASFDANGRYLLLTARTGIPKFASNNRNEGTAEENKAVVQGSIAHFVSERMPTCGAPMRACHCPREALCRHCWRP
ncbi:MULTISPECIES: lipocalin-like domain-containing protein [unclassified Bradyrhizobium]|uniref:lipocalin-like domain-containing protein n=1 Tax=unclassified Bradyrhizobium TaxID=2631580 RepID=UPI0015CC7534|nr:MULTISPECIES: lipocalin-like domain-containing protein [unclassified Bradyrhizobium]MBB4392439.1 hypothetical protein [Bradyrhizobium sp. ERR14]NYG48221.1 hypothetical protein [Bradyrhizobium sp. IAR9]